MAMSTFPIVSGAQIVSLGDTSAKHEPGTIMAYRNPTTGGWALAQYVVNGNVTLNQGEVAMHNSATLSSGGVLAAVAGDEGAPLGGIAAATIASLKYGWIFIHGYVEKADLSHTAAAGEYLTVSGSTAAKLTPHRASVFNAGTQGSVSAFMVCGVSRAALATGVGSITLLGCWGV